MRAMPVVLPTFITPQRTAEAILPVEYVAACKSIASCRSLDETKYWADKADALAAWAKIYKNDQAAVEARKLKLHAFRRMSKLADELQPVIYNRGPGTKGNTKPPGPRDALKKAGITGGALQHIRRIGAIPQRKFDELIAMSDPPGINKAGEFGRGRSYKKAVTSTAWRAMVDGFDTSSISPARFVSRFCRQKSAKDLAQGLYHGEVAAARKLVTEAAEWFDEFEQYLPKLST